MSGFERDSDAVDRSRDPGEIPADDLFDVHHDRALWKLAYQQWSSTLQEMVTAWALQRGCDLVNTDNPYPFAERGSRVSRER